MSQNLIDALRSEMAGQQYQAAIAIYHEMEPPYSEAMLDALIDALGDVHDGVRTYAVKTLIKMNEQATQRILKRLPSLTSPGHIAACVEVLGSHRHINGHYPTLVQLYRNGVAVVRVAVLQAISRHPVRDADELLIEALTDPNSQARYFAGLGLARRKQSTAPQALINATDDQVVLVRGAALYALGKIGDPQAIDSIVNALRASIEDTNVDPAVTAVAGQPMTSEQYQRFMASHGQIDLPAMATHALAWIGEPALPVLKVLLRDQEPKIRQCAAWAIGLMGNEEATEEYLRVMLKDESPRVRAMAAKMLNKNAEGD
jgi:HEAT repeat protein